MNNLNAKVILEPTLSRTKDVYIHEYDAPHGPINIKHSLEKPIPFPSDNSTIFFYWTVDENTSPTKEYNHDHFLKDTFHLVSYYGTRQHIDMTNKTLNFSLLHDYYLKYGQPFPGTAGNNFINARMIGDIFSEINNYLLWLNPEKLILICNAIITATNLKFKSHKNDNYLKFLRKDDVCYVRFLRKGDVSTPDILNDESPNKITSNFAQLFDYMTLDKPYDEYILEVSNYDFRHVIYSMSYAGMPSFCFEVTKNDLIRIKQTKDAGWKDWFTEKTINSLNQSLNSVSHDIKFNVLNGVPEMILKIKNNMLVFLLNLLTSPNSYNICPYCKAIVTNGNLYCSVKHKQNHYTKTDRGKLLNLLNKWEKRYQLSPETYKRCQNWALSKLDEGYSYNRILLELKKIREGAK